MRRRLNDLLEVLPVDARTLKRAVERAGIGITYCGRSGPLVAAEDFERIRRDGIPYYKDTITEQGIR